MSATNRGSLRCSKDYYRTPELTVKSFIEAFILSEPDFDVTKANILDPCAGGDVVDPTMPYPKILSSFGAVNLHTMDIRPDSSAIQIEDYLRTECKKFDAIFSNPPYGLNMPFIEKALNDVLDGGFVGFLLRLNYYGSVARKNFWIETMPKYTFIHSKRPSFIKGGTDATEYAHFVWQKGLNPKFSQLIIL